MRSARSAALLLTLAACEGTVLAPRGGGGNVPVDPLTGEPKVELPGPSSRAARLSHVEYENTTRDLLGLQQLPGVTAMFVPDVTSTTFTNNGGDLFVTGDQWQDYQAAAEELARRATASTAALTAAAGGTLPTDDASLVAALGRRAFRRPLTSAEQTAYTALFAKGPMFYPELQARLAGARLTLDGLLQSPYFLYRVELSTGDGAKVALSASELASRLSYALWQSMPDDALLDAAADGSLLEPATYSSHVERLLGDARTATTIQVFHAELLGQAKYADITRSMTLFPEFSLELRES
jgi:hypothetical protein